MSQTNDSKFNISKIVRNLIFISLGLGGIVHEMFIVSPPSIVILFWSLMLLTLAPILELDKEGATIRQFLTVLTAKPQLPPPEEDKKELPPTEEEKK